MIFSQIKSDDRFLGTDNDSFERKVSRTEKLQ